MPSSRQPAGLAWPSDLVLGDHVGGGRSTSPAAIAGTPAITVPAGQVRGLPVGLSFFAQAWSEARLLGLACAFEQASHARLPPRDLPRIEVWARPPGRAPGHTRHGPEVYR